MTYNGRSKFSWSFTGYPLEAEAQKGLDEMLEWFRSTFNEAEWETKSSVYNTPYGFGASLTADRNVAGE